MLKKRQISAGTKYFLIAIPFMVFIIAMAYVPIFGWLYAFTDFKTGRYFTDFTFVGFKSFAKIFQHSSEVLRVLRNTLVMSGLGLLSSPLPVITAIFLNEFKSKKFKSFVQTTTTLPNFISWIVVFGIAFSFFSNGGLLNSFLGWLGLPQSPTGLMGDANLVWFFQLGLQIWKGLGWSTIIYLAAITSIDEQLYEAAQIDGANKLRLIWHITVPGIAPTYFVLFILGVSSILSSGFDQYFMFRNPLVADKIEVLDYFVYKIGILSGDYPFSIAIGITKTLISITLLFTVNRLSKRVRGQSIF